MEERRRDQEHFMKVLDEQNQLLQEILDILKPVAEFFKALSTVVKVVMGIAGFVAVVWGTWEAIKAYAKSH